ncbi:MAG: hypothetical protein QOK37_3181 [Thermoanaerobaculia bacterium]|nr:hypothetical protein [Thermoanaerobaculia bacterium]
MSAEQRKSPIAILVPGAAVIGSLDIAYAIIFSAFRGFGPIRVLQSVAAGLLGRSSFEGGLPTAILGLALHYSIATTILIVYWLASGYVPALTKHPILCGAIYGLGVYFFMNYIVIPLSHANRPRFFIVLFICNLIVHAFLIGVPAALFTRAARNAR